MRPATFFVIAILPALSLAQSVQSLISSIPFCAVRLSPLSHSASYSSCHFQSQISPFSLPAVSVNTHQLGPFTVAAGDSGCDLTNISCLCNDTSFISSLTKSVEAVCSSDDVDKVVQLATGECKTVGVNVDIPVTTKNDPSWGERSSTVNLAMIVGIVGLAAQAGI
jgi:hypothetical protein